MDKEEYKKTPTLYERVYPVPNILLTMEYFKAEIDGRREIRYSNELKSTDKRAFFKLVAGAYCMKCGEFIEFDEHIDKEKSICKCGTKLKDMYIYNVNGRGRYAKDMFSCLTSAFPHRLTISARDDKVIVNATCKNWYFNAKAAKPYSRRYSVRIILNTATGQSYFFQPKKNGKAVFDAFSDKDSVMNATFTDAYEVSEVNKIFFSDPENRAALYSVLADHTPYCRENADLREAINNLYLGDLADCFPAEKWRDTYVVKKEEVMPYRMLRKRMRKNSETFPKYLYWGCSKVATKSIRKALYKYPEQKWTLRFLYKDLGITNIDIIRRVLSDRDSFIRQLALNANYIYDTEEKKAFTELLAVCRESKMTDQKKVSFFSSSDYLREVRDTARLQSLHHLSADALQQCCTMKEFHDMLVEHDMRNRNAVLWERYNALIDYPDKINALEGPCGNANFMVIRKPWDLKDLGEKFHNCVGTYMEDVIRRRSIIVEMTIDDAPAACIELDSNGKSCYQALAVCNEKLNGTAAESFNAWADKYNISRDGSDNPRHARYYMPFNGAIDDPFDAPFDAVIPF